MKIGYGKDFCGAKKSPNAPNVETGTSLKTNGHKNAPQDKSALEKKKKNLLSKSTNPQTNEAVRGLRQEVPSDGATYDEGDMRLRYNGA